MPSSDCKIIPKFSSTPINSPLISPSVAGSFSPCASPFHSECIGRGPSSSQRLIQTSECRVHASRRAGASTSAQPSANRAVTSGVRPVSSSAGQRASSKPITSQSGSLSGSSGSAAIFKDPAMPPFTRMLPFHSRCTPTSGGASAPSAFWNPTPQIGSMTAASRSDTSGAKTIAARRISGRNSYVTNPASHPSRARRHARANGGSPRAALL